jgi:hypothetical protein
LNVDRSAEACGDCHYRGDKTEIDTKGGFVRHHEQFEEMIQTKHNSLTCVSCHDPHEGVIQARKEGTSTTRVDCEACHYENAENQKSAVMQSMVNCIDCHMPRITKSAVGDAAQWSGDIRTHFFAIDHDADAQFSEDGGVAISQVTLDWACKSCQGAEGSYSQRTDEELLAEATDYHQGH